MTDSGPVFLARVWCVCVDMVNKLLACVIEVVCDDEMAPFSYHTTTNAQYYYVCADS